VLSWSGGKAPQIEKYPEIHDLAHKIMLAGSACEQDVHRADGLKLVDLVNRFAEIYGRRRTSRPCASPAPVIGLGFVSERELVGLAILRLFNNRIRLIRRRCR
jgi:hypothetical protein